MLRETPSDRAQAVEAAGLALAREALIGEGLTALGSYHLEIRDAAGNLKHAEDAANILTTIGKLYLLDSALSGSGYTAALYLGLVDNASAPTYAAADTMASHAGWTENQAYTAGTRPSVTFSAATANGSAGQKVSVGVQFTLNAAAAIAGCFMVTSSTKGGTAGTLISETTFSAGARTALASADLITLTYTLTYT